jgi:hypothetical protein
VNTATLTIGRRLLITGLFCLGAAWIAGPAPRFGAALLLILFAPGYVIERALGIAHPHLLIRSMLWIGLSATAMALLYQAAWVLHIRLSPAILTALLLTVSTAAVGLAWRECSMQHASAAGVWALFGIICLLTLAVRFVQIADLALPAWVDPVHHTLMVRVAAEQGMAPVDLNPYLPVAELPYHWGYHVLIAAAHVLSGHALPAALLWSGQLLNALQAVGAGALALLFWRRPAAAVVAALITGLVSIFPAYYVTWGRYTQLAGLLLVPGLAAAWAYALGPTDSATPITPRRGWWIAAALLLAGLSLIHFRILIFGLALIGAQSLVWALSVSRRQLLRSLIPAALTALGSLALAAPWLALLLRRTLLPAIPQPANLVGESSYTALTLGLLWAGQNRALVALALTAALLLIWQRRSATLIVLGWVAGMVVLANPGLLTYILPALGVPLWVQGMLRRDLRLVALGAPLLVINPWLVHLPATWLITNDVVTISLFLPLSMLIGGGAAVLLEQLQRRHRAQRQAIGRLAALLTLSVALWGGWQMRDVLNRSTVFATAADVTAIAWVAANTAPDARFLINAAPWLGAADRGVDGGWWLLPLTGRWTSTPPVLFIYGDSADIAATRERSRTVIDFTPGEEASIDALIAREGIDYLYFGPQPGPLRPDYFRSRPGFQSVYEHDGVTILAVGS